MNTRIEEMQNALAFIEQNLTGELSIKEAAAKAHVSEFHFRHIFTELYGLTVGEYIRKRRLTLAARELSGGAARVVDVAVKYGYDSPDSFARAFERFHGSTPSAAKKRKAKLRSLAPLEVHLLQENRAVTEYEITEKAALTLLGRKQRFDLEDSLDKIPAFWNKHRADGGSSIVSGMYGLCIDSDGRHFDYYIADACRPGQKAPEGYEIITLPAGTWAVFPCTLGTLQAATAKMWTEAAYLEEYRPGRSYNIERYFPPCRENPGDSYCELWLPLQKNKT